MSLDCFPTTIVRITPESTTADQRKYSPISKIKEPLDQLK